MTGKQRLQCALRHQEPDMVPIFECVYSRPLFQEVLGYVPETFDPVSVYTCSQKIGYDFVFIPIPGVSGFRPEGETREIYVDEWSITRKQVPTTWPIDAGIKTPLEDGEDWKNFTMPDPREPFRYTGLRDVLKLAQESGMGVIGNVRGPYSAAWQLFGMENFDCMLFEEPETIHACLTAMTDFALTSAEIMIQMGVDAMLYSDDYGSGTQPLMSPKHFQEFLVPQLTRICAKTKQLGSIPLLHCDGAINPLLPDIMSTGIEGLHPLERAAGMDLAAVKKAYGDKVCLFGNIDNKELLLKGTKADIESQVRECIETAAPGGGFCLGSDHSVHDDLPNENIFALYEAGRKYGSYPIGKGK